MHISLLEELNSSGQVGILVSFSNYLKYVKAWLYFPKADAESQVDFHIPNFSSTKPCIFPSTFRLNTERRLEKRKAEMLKGQTSCSTVSLIVFTTYM